MSLASVRSCRGDSYEILIALRWAIRMLHDPDILRVAVDSTDLDPSGNPIQVDDVVIYHRSGLTTYCQCKENQPGFKPWKVADLTDDLQKAANQLVAVQVNNELFDLRPPVNNLSADFLRRLVEALPQGERGQRQSLHAFFQWLSAIMPPSFDEALEAMEIMLATINADSTDFWFLADGSILNSLFQEAEEREQSDAGAFLARVIAVQDTLLKTGAHGLDQWLKDAERP